MKAYSLIVLACLVIGLGAHTYHSGECPSVEPMPNFDMNRFLGIWYVIQKTSTASSCLYYNITASDEPGEYNIEQVSQHFVLGITPLKHIYKYTGTLKRHDQTVPAKFTVKFPLNVAGESSFTIFMTDYDTYAGIYSCQKVTFSHRESATLLSRTKELSNLYLDKMRNRLSSYNVDPFDLSIVKQTECPKMDEGFQININPDTFSSKSIGNAVRKTGSAIGDGVESLINWGKKTYHKLTNSEDDTETLPTPVTTDHKKSFSHMPENKNSDAEWIRV